MKTGLLTNLSVHQIEERIVSREGGIRDNIYVPNVSWGFFGGHEADLVRITRSGYLYEYEIKRSWTDFKADFKKSRFHDDKRIAAMYYVVPEAIQDDVVAFLQEKGFDYRHIGVYSYTDGSSSLRLVKKASKPVRYWQKLNSEEVAAIARLGVLRYWKLRWKMDFEEAKKAYGDLANV